MVLSLISGRKGMKSAFRFGRSLTPDEFVALGFRTGHTSHYTAFDRYEYETAAAILILIIGIVMALEYLSGKSLCILFRWC